MLPEKLFQVPFFGRSDTSTVYSDIPCKIFHAYVCPGGDGHSGRLQNLGSPCIASSWEKKFGAGLVKKGVTDESRIGSQCYGITLFIPRKGFSYKIAEGEKSLPAEFDPINVRSCGIVFHSLVDPNQVENTCRGPECCFYGNENSCLRVPVKVLVSPAKLDIAESVESRGDPAQVIRYGTIGQDNSGVSAVYGYMDGHRFVL